MRKYVLDVTHLNFWGLIFCCCPSSIRSIRLFFIRMNSTRNISERFTGTHTHTHARGRLLLLFLLRLEIGVKTLTTREKQQGNMFDKSNDFNSIFHPIWCMRWDSICKKTH